VQHSVEFTDTPYSTAERFFKEAALRIAPLTVNAVQELAQQSAKLILGIDDFAIRKGHNYNTGIHDLRGESLLGIAEGRTLVELRTYMEENPLITALKPYAIIMDLAKNYHSFAAEFFPGAIRVADRFHVNRYILDALNEIRRRVSKELMPQARMNLKRNKHLLNKRNDSLDGAEREQLGKLLGYSSDLKDTYELKELLIDWYDLSFNYNTAKNGYQRWCAKGYALNIPEVNNALKTFTNWQDEIVNYHRCRFTNGIVEGRNAKIKALQRRRYFLRNRTFYESLILIECNKDMARFQFKRLLA
jgi:transposase